LGVSENLKYIDKLVFHTTDFKGVLLKTWMHVHAPKVLILSTFKELKASNYDNYEYFIISSRYIF
jgi:hypothetical protein